METSVYEQFYMVEKEHWWFAGMRTLCRAMLKRLPIGNGDQETRCLDVGCGAGLWTQELGAFGQACGLDVADEALQFCRRRGNNRLVRATAERLPFKPDSYGLITAIGVIEHIGDEKGFLSELARVCRPGGYVLFLTSAYDFLWSRHDEIVHHKRRYTKGQFTQLLTSCGFQVVRSSYVNTFLFLPILIIRLGQRLSVGPAVLEKRSPDVFIPAPLVNKLLYWILWTETKILNFVSFPFGVGLFAIARMPSGYEHMREGQPWQPS
ncbi:MAG: class I SAM-dependent methyltransferase [Candidatus Methylomirabilales bacterium]